MTPTWSDFVDGWELFADPALCGAIVGALLGYLGVYVVLKRMVFLSAALSQSAGFGVTLAFYAQLHWGLTGLLGAPTLWALAIALLAAVIIAVDKSALGARRDSLLGLIYLVGGAGAIAVGTRIVQEVQDVHTILFGSAVAVLPEDLRLVTVIAVVLFAVHLWWLRGFLQASFDREGAFVRGLPVRLLDLTLLFTIAVAISVCTRVVGALPVFAFSVLPAMAAVRIAQNANRAFFLATALGAFSGFAGYVAAFLYELPVGPAQTLLAVTLVGVAEGIRMARRVLVHGRLA